MRLNIKRIYLFLQKTSNHEGVNPIISRVYPLSRFHDLHNAICPANLRINEQTTK